MTFSRGSLLAASVAVLVAAGARPARTAPEKKPTAPEVDLDSMVELLPATIAMGYPDATPNPYGSQWWVDQQPEHAVDVGAFRLDRTEVTVAAFASFLTWSGGEAHWHRDQPIAPVPGGYRALEGTENEPIRQVTWQAAAHYCAWAGKRLPTEAEWERAAAGEEDRLFPWGNTNGGCDHGVFFAGSAHCEERHVPVGSRPLGATPDGVLDLAGSVGEWTADWYGPYAAEAQVDPAGPPEGTYKVIRGGGRRDGRLAIRTHARVAARPEARSEDVGFRCAWSAPEAVPARRGPLPEPAGIGRPRPPRAPAAPLPDVIAAGLQSPGAVALGTDGTLVVLETGAGRVLSVDPSTGAVAELAGGFVALSDLALEGDTLYVADGGTGEIWHLPSAAAPALLATVESGTVHLAARDGELYVATAAALRVVRAGGVLEDLATGLDGVNGITLSSTHVVFAEEGATVSSRARVARVPRAGGAVEVLAGNDVFGANFRPTDAAVDEGQGRVFVPVVQRGFPNASLACAVPIGGGALACYDYAPGQIDRIVVAGSHAWLSTRRSLTRVSLALDEPYTVPGTWTQPGGIVLTGESVVWSDVPSGRMLRAPR